MPQPSLSESLVSGKGILEHYVDFADAKRELQKWGVENAKKSSLKPEPRASQHWCWEALWSNHILEELNEAPNGPWWDHLPLNPTRDYMGSSSALPPLQDVKWKGVELAKGAAELACVCGPSCSFLAHAGKDPIGRLQRLIVFQYKISFPMDSPWFDGAGVKQGALFLQKVKGTSFHVDFFLRLHQHRNGLIWPDCKTRTEIFARLSKAWVSSAW